MSKRSRKTKEYGSSSSPPQLNDDAWKVIAQFIDIYDASTLLTFISISKKHVTYADAPLNGLLTGLLINVHGFTLGDDHSMSNEYAVVSNVWSTITARICVRQTWPLLAFFGELEGISVNAHACSSFYEHLGNCSREGFTTESASIMLSVFNLSLLCNYPYCSLPLPIAMSHSEALSCIIHGM